ncbi:hypothetical protein [Tumebacillus lipolyticus]|uniref:Uncharacterized protein n=1 Tax=Tumebacillus lipolyticus TaxID=1280370 RepID=A0ABW5A3F3_9BACL
MDRNVVHPLLERLDGDPDLRKIQKQLSAIEEKMRAGISEEAWNLVLEWEALWALYANLCIEKLYRATNEAPT